MIVMDKNAQLRHLPPGCLFKLCQILDECGWKEVMAIIPSDPLIISSKPKYSVEHIRLVESYGDKHNRSYTEILIQEWGTSGRVRATVQNLLDVLIRAELFRAADFVAVELLEEATPTRPTDGPAALVNVSIDELTNPVVHLGAPHIPENVETSLINIPYALLYEITNHFNEAPLNTTKSEHGLTEYTGNKLGAGAFGAVYYGVMPDGTPVAVKKLINDTIGLFNQFQTEITILSTYRHQNLLPLLGYSCDTADYCLIYEFMPNRSLQDRLAVSAHNEISESPLHWRLRVDLAIGVCRGIHYLHTARSPPLIHRDVKTANILLDSNMGARLGDFGLVRTSPTDSRMTSTVFGTSAYMAPEAFRGDVSVKTDVFSMGVVLLELLTAQPSYDESREGRDLVTFVEEAVDETIEPLLDPSAYWNVPVADTIFAIAQKCLEDKKKRPVIGEVIEALCQTVENVSDA